MTDQLPQNEPCSDGPRKPPQMSALFVIVWVLGLLALIVLAGCTVAVITVGELSGIDAAALLGVLLMLAALFAYGRSLFKGRRLERAQEPPSTLFLYIFLIPVVAAFVWAGGCLLIIQ
ncbi:MAG: hypothetical protein AB8B93_18545 [Pseudomonadales bacterium]